MTATPDDRQPEHPARPHDGGAGPSPQPHDGGAGPSPAFLADDEDWGDCLTDDQVAELTRRDWEDPDPGDPEYADDPETGPPPEWLALPPAEQARLLAEEHERSRSVPEAFDAGFNRSRAGRLGTGFAAGGPLDVMLPGNDLAWHVGHARRDLAGLDDDQLTGVMIGGQKLEAWAGELKLAAVAELTARRIARDGEEGHKAPEEIGAALTQTARSADILAGLAAELDRLPKVKALLASGIIDMPRVKVITRYTAPLSDEEAAAVEDVIARRAGELNTGRLAAACDAAAKAADPAAAKRRKEKALRNARVEAWAEPDGTAALAGRDLPPAQVIAADKSLDADAKWLRDHAIEGSWDELRAMAYLCRLDRLPLESLLPTPVSTACNPAASPAPSAGTGGTGAEPANGAGCGSAGAQDGPVPGGTVPGGTVNLTMPWSAFQRGSDRPGEVAGFGAVDADTCRDLASRLQAAGSGTRWCITLTDQDGHAVGHGCARAGPGPPGSDPVSWLATVTIHKIETGSCAHEHQSAGYQPSQTLRHLVKTRSRRCGYPGCGRPATRCDDDHSLAYHLGGRTCECNLHPLCRRHHRTKQAPGWHLDQPRPGSLVWTLPSGRRFGSTVDPYPT